MFGGRIALDEFTELRWIGVQTEPQHDPIRLFPAPARQGCAGVNDDNLPGR